MAKFFVADPNHSRTIVPASEFKDMPDGTLGRIVTLFKHFWGTISRGITQGFPEWYKGTVSVDPFAPAPLEVLPIGEPNMAEINAIQEQCEKVIEQTFGIPPEAVDGLPGRSIAFVEGKAA
jgi:hypothetical protein